MKYLYENEVDRDIVKVVQYGLGPIGKSSARAALAVDMVQLVGAVDIDPDLMHKDLGDVLELSEKLGIEVVNDIKQISKVADVDVVLHTTSSFIDIVFDQFKSIMEEGANIVSTAEELLLPDFRNPLRARELDSIAKANHVTCLGTGVNPGFAMDTLAVCLTGICNRVDHIYAERVVDAATRRGPLQKKIGAGLEVEQFKNLADEGKLGHIGLKDSIAFIARGIGWQLDSIVETLEPVVAEQNIATDYVDIKAGQAAGIKNIGTGSYQGKELIKLDLRMYIGAKKPHDSVKVTGKPPVDMVVRNGFSGDEATVAALVNSIPHVVKASPGICTMMDLPVPRIFQGKENF